MFLKRFSLETVFARVAKRRAVLDVRYNSYNLKSTDIMNFQERINFIRWLEDLTGLVFILTTHHWILVLFKHEIC